MTSHLPSAPNSLVPVTIRRATWSDLPAIARASTLAFWNDVLFGRLIHPHRQTYPDDNDLYWLRRVQCSYWDWSHVFLVAITTSASPTSATDPASSSQQPVLNSSENHPLLAKGSERVIGTAQWSRIAPSRHANYLASWDLAWYDPRRLLSPLLNIYWSLYSLIRPNRAADPEKEWIIESSYGYLDHIWTEENHRSPSWYLEGIATLPEYQGRGVGRQLVQWGICQADKEGICVSVISAEGKEQFYQRCGFDVGPVGWSGEGEGNPLREVPGGLIFVREAKDVREGRVRREDTARKGWSHGGVETEFV